MAKFIKKNLLSNNQHLQFETIFKLAQDLDINQSQLTQQQRLEFINNLIHWDIGSLLCNFLAVNDYEVMKSTLLCLSNISESNLFYAKNLASQVISQILQNGYLIAQKAMQEHKILKIMAITLTNIFTKANLFKTDLNIAGQIDQLLEFIIQSNIKTAINPAHILTFLELYEVVLRQIEHLDDHSVSPLIAQIHEEILTSASNAALAFVKRRDDMIRMILKIVKVCDTGLKFCAINDDSSYTSRNSNSSDGEEDRINYSKLVVNITYKTMLEIIIPNAKLSDVPDNEHFIDILIHLINCLYELYKRQDVNINEISIQLILQGYLGYLWGLCYEPYQEPICDCIANMISSAAQNNFQLNKWNDGVCGFRRFIKSGLLSVLRNNMSDDSESDAFLFLCYFHYTMSRDYTFLNNLKNISIPTKIMNIRIDNVPEIVNFQLYFLLFAILVLEDLLHVDNFSDVVNRIIEIVQTIGLENCYVHDPVLPCFILHNSVFPKKIRVNVVELWLEIEPIVHPFVSPGRKIILIDCLLEIILADNKNLRERAMNELLRMIRYDDTSESLIEHHITQDMWNKLPRVLNDFTENLGRDIEFYLKMLNRLSTDDVSNLSVIQYSNVLISTLDQENLVMNANIKTLLVKQMSKLLSHALVAKIQEVILLYTNNYKLLDNLCKQAFSKEDDNLSIACYSCLSVVLHSQKQFSVKCDKPILLHLMDPLNALLRKQYVRIEVMRFLDKIRDSEIEYPIILHPIYTESEAKKTLTRIYKLYIDTHLKAPESQWNFTFYYLTSLLKFYRKNYDFLLFFCCDYVSNHVIVCNAIECAYTNINFFEFLNTWLRFGLYGHCSFMINALESKKAQAIEKEKEIIFTTTFDEALQKVDNYITELIAKEKIQSNDIKDVKTTLAKFI